MGRSQKKVTTPQKIKCLNVSEDKVVIIYNGQSVPYGDFLFLDKEDLQSPEIKQFFTRNMLKIVGMVDDNFPMNISDSNGFTITRRKITNILYELSFR